MEKKCNFCREPMNGEENKSANGSYIHKECQEGFKSMFRKCPVCRESEKIFCRCFINKKLIVGKASIKENEN